ncbi:sugar transferase [Tritonibacter horizontis]|uniref:Undecaprenyl phosphate N,N'-diacetylbacillosamine 1-phosphate transferase n=1 Tax=Tritonibacter horizontis TaxID=1768241 RepID=A0A132BYQ9_9RHOB|nr:sugar transferase [Tritonibacter horizontis]KUP93538.1 undecaprenyl phosphate N,N'-diacetylbacillosamine 1-phosphate transferase [Tritonibacter horizontis]
MLDIVQELHSREVHQHHIEGHNGIYAQVGKRLFDLCLALLLLPLILPIIAILAILARRDGGEAFFGHKRVGQDGVSFRCWKIRSMVPDAAARLKKHLDENPEAAAEWARDHKLTNDPRITRFGNFIRKTSLDELPQILNVLKGEMTFVGPRPVITDELPKYGNKVQHYLAQKPGITGLWQVSGRNDVSYDERVDMDVAYLERRSLMLDINIIARTALAVLGTTGR